MITRRSLFLRTAAMFAGSLLARLPLAGAKPEPAGRINVDTGPMQTDAVILSPGGFLMPPDIADKLREFIASGEITAKRTVCIGGPLDGRTVPTAADYHCYGPHRPQDGPHYVNSGIYLDGSPHRVWLHSEAKAT